MPPRYKQVSGTCVILIGGAVWVHLQGYCKLSDQKWAALLQSIEDFINDPRSTIFREGPSEHGEEWEAVVDDFCSDVSDTYWGVECGEIWSIGDNDEHPDRARIRSFLRGCFLHALDLAPGPELTAMDDDILRNDPQFVHKAVTSREELSTPRESDDELALPPRPNTKTNRWTATGVIKSEPTGKGKKPEKRTRNTKDASSDGVAAPLRKRNRVQISPSTPSTVAIGGDVGEGFFNTPGSTSGTNDTPTPTIKKDSSGDVMESITLAREMVAKATPVKPLRVAKKKAGPKMTPAPQRALGPTSDESLALITERMSSGSIDVSNTVEFIPGRIYKPVSFAPSRKPTIPNDAGESAPKQRFAPSGELSTRPNLTLHSTIGDHSDRVSKFIHLDDGLSLRKLVGTLRSKHALTVDEQIASIGMMFQGDYIKINMQDAESEWDWRAWMKFEGKKGGLVSLDLTLVEI